MTYSKLTDQVKFSSQSSSRNGAEIDTFLIHHQAGTNDDAVISAMVSGSRGVSANYTVSNEGRITSVVPEELRAWTSGSQYDGGKGAAWDRRSITVEIENEVAGGSWDISPTALNAAAALLQDLRARYTIKNVLGHRDLWNRYQASYPTFCPGPETVAKIVALAGTKPASSETALKRRKKNMTTGYYTERNGKTEWAVGGESPGTPANWFTISTQKTANEFAAVHGPFVFLGPTSFDAFAARYLSPLAVAGGVLGGSADLSPVLAAVSGVSDQIKQFPTTSVDLSPVLTEIKKLPTADQTAAAVRTKLIAKE
tara:strand:+ start:978 stop:1913 length:936 start_codon:yes stop_codon:yes gene_type:complete